MNIPTYNQIYTFIDFFLSRITNIDTIKARIIMIIHYPIMYMKTFKLLFGKINIIWWLCLFALVFIIILNIVYDGCIFMKMERKYMKSKEWFGPYNLPVQLGILNKEYILPFFYGIQILIFIIIFYRIFIHFY